MPPLNSIRALIRATSGADDVARSVKPIRAYHGSPYDFDRFDSSKIGTGEGAQAYGHGMYFSGAEPVAKWYREQLSGSPDLIIGGEPIRWTPHTRTPRERALRLLQKSAITYYDNPIQAVREAMLDASDQYGGRDVQPIIDSLMRFESDGISFGPRPGRMYEVELDVPEEAFLDWDKPVMRQAGPVADYAKSLGYGGDVWRGQEMYLDLGRFTPEDVRPGWTSILNTINDVTTRPQVAAARLMEAGIPGIRYLDGSSRAAGEGTRNYVMFPGTEDHIRILRKYGLLAPMALPALQEAE